MRAFSPQKTVARICASRVRLAVCVTCAPLFAGCFSLNWRGKQSVHALQKQPETEQVESLDEIAARLPHYTVSGRVVNWDGKPIPGAQVCLYFYSGRDGLQERAAGKMKTDAKGRYCFRKALVWEPVRKEKDYQDNPQYIVIATHPDYGARFITLLQGDRTDKVDVVLPVRGAEDLGISYPPITVTDTQGRPVAGARVYLAQITYDVAETPNIIHIYSSPHLHQDAGVYSTVTDQRGQFARFSAYSCAYTVEKEGYGKGSAVCNCTLSPVFQVMGRVTYSDGEPAAGAAVFFTYSGDGANGSDVTVTDQYGRYAFNCASGKRAYQAINRTATVEPNAKGVGTLKAEDLRPGTPYLKKEVSFPLDFGAPVIKDLSFDRGCLVSGKVMDVNSGKPASNVRLACNDLLLVTDKDGGFRTAVTTGSSVTLMYKNAGSERNYILEQEMRSGTHIASSNEPLVVRKDMTDLVLRVRLEPVTTLEGRMAPDGKSSTQTANVYLLNQFPAARTNTNGDFSFKAVPKDRDFDLFATSDDGARAGMAHLKTGARKALIHLEPTRELQGCVLSPDGVPIPDVSFFLAIKVNGDRMTLPEKPVTSVKTDFLGRFTAKNLYPKGIYTMYWASSTTNNSYQPDDKEIDLAKLKEGESIVFHARRPFSVRTTDHRLEGRVVNENGEPIVGARIEVDAENAEPMTVPHATAISDKDGAFTVAGLASGEVMLRVVANGYKTRSFMTRTGTVDVTAVMKPATREDFYNCDVTVRDEKGQPVAGAPLSLWMHFFTVKAITQTLKAITDANGHARFSYQMPDGEEPFGDARTHGICFVECDTKGFDLAYRGVDFGEDTETTIALTRFSGHPKGRVVDWRGKPLRNATVRVIEAFPRASSNYSAIAYLSWRDEKPIALDRKGRFELSRFGSRDRIRVDIAAPGCSPEYACFTGSEGGRERTFMLLPGATIKGKVEIAGKGAPAFPMRVQAFGKRWDSPTCSVKPDGTFEFGGVGPGEYSLRAYGDNAETSQVLCRPVIVEAEVGKAAEVTLRFEPGVLVKGRVIDAVTKAAPLGKHSITFHSFAGPPVAYAAIEADGSWKACLPEGEFTCNFEGTSLLLGSNRTIAVTKGKPMESLVIEVKAMTFPLTRNLTGH